MRHTLAAVLCAILVPVTAIAQTTKPPVPHDQVLSVNPFGFIVQWFNAEYERKTSDSTTVGVSASHFVDAGQSNAAILLRWYPQQAALDGFYLGVRAGGHRFTTHRYDYSAPSSPSNLPRATYNEQTSARAGVGFEIGHNWLLGPKQNASVGLGFGMTRLMGCGNSYEMPCVLPAFRLNVGIAF